MMGARLALVLAVLSAGAAVAGGWSDEDLKKITARMQSLVPDWEHSDTVELIDPRIAGTTYASPRFGRDGELVQIQVLQGRIVLVNGRDITGNLGTKITHGDQSPIIETYGSESPVEFNAVAAAESQVVVGDESSAVSAAGGSRVAAGQGIAQVDAAGSNMTAGDRSPIDSTSVTLRLALPISLGVNILSVPLNVYLVARLRRRQPG